MDDLGHPDNQGGNLWSVLTVAIPSILSQYVALDAIADSGEHVLFVEGSCPAVSNIAITAGASTRATGGR